jgi:two-component system, OmpR family, KDP operon response regulator KdpE
MSLTVLLVEDDPQLRATLRAALDVEGWQVRSAASLADARAQAAQAQREGELDLVLLDLGLPDGDGRELLDALRGGHAVPVIVISARQAETQKVALLDAGADDYLVKPFGIDELLARMRVALRHRGRRAEPAVTRWRHAELVVDLAAHRVERAGQPVRLTPTEFNLLARLVRSAGQVVTHRALLVDVWGAEYAEHTHYLRLYMSQLRAKLEPVPAEPRRLLTEPGVGYRLTEGDGPIASGTGPASGS